VTADLPVHELQGIRRREAEEAVLEELRATISASRLSCFHACRLRFYFQYVLEIQTPATPALFVGQAVHRLLQEWNLQRWRGTPREPEHYRSLLGKVWEEADTVAWKGDPVAEQEVVWKLFEYYLEQNPIPEDEKPLGVEVGVHAPLGDGLPDLFGYLDLVRPTGVIVDFKTSASTPPEGQAAHRHWFQLVGYAYLYRESTGEKERGVEFHHLIKTKAPKLVVSGSPGVSDTAIQAFRDSVKSYTQGLDARDWCPSPGLACMGCPFVGRCSAHIGISLPGRS